MACHGTALYAFSYPTAFLDEWVSLLCIASLMSGCRFSASLMSGCRFSAFLDEWVSLLCIASLQLLCILPPCSSLPGAPAPPPGPATGHEGRWCDLRPECAANHQRAHCRCPGLWAGPRGGRSGAGQDTPTMTTHVTSWHLVAPHGTSWHLMAPHGTP